MLKYNSYGVEIQFSNLFLVYSYSGNALLFSAQQNNERHFISHFKQNSDIKPLDLGLRLHAYNTDKKKQSHVNTFKYSFIAVN